MTYPAFDLSSKTAVVIGGTSGIGLALAKGLAQAGANVVPTGRRAELVRSVADEIVSMGRRSLAFPSDVTDRASLDQLLHATCKEFGSVDILVNAAGFTKRTPTLEVSESEWNSVLETNLNGTLRACQIFGRHMIERKYGRIINIASLGSFVSLLRSRSLLRQQSWRGFFDENPGHRVGPPRRYASMPSLREYSGLTSTQPCSMGRRAGRELLIRTPMRRLGKVEELIGAAIFLASDAASFVTGHLLVVDGGFLASGVNQ